MSYETIFEPLCPSARNADSPKSHTQIHAYIHQSSRNYTTVAFGSSFFYTASRLLPYRDRTASHECCNTCSKTPLRPDTLRTQYSAPYSNSLFIGCKVTTRGRQIVSAPLFFLHSRTTPRYKVYFLVNNSNFFISALCINSILFSH